jgi:NADPH-dependent 2,4-dienoyl-CoA reductase/sulfur reductase-like enzyme
MKVCIIGAGDAGAIAALQISRLDSKAEIDVFSKRAELGCPPCEMPLVLSGNVAHWEELVRGLRTKAFYEKRSINVHLNAEVTEVFRKEKYVVANGQRYGYDKLILALGAIPSLPSLPGLDGRNEFVLSTDMADGISLENNIPKYDKAAIIGGGFIGLEIAAALKARGYHKIHLLARRDILRAHLDKDMAEILEALLKENGVELITHARIDDIKSQGEVKRVILSERERELEVDFVFFATGAEPDVELARKARLQIGETGAIAVNHYLQTSDPDIYAIGDCMENWDVIIGSKRRIQLATNAIRTGYIAGRNTVLSNTIAYEGTVMPFVTKVFGHQIGDVGLTEREAKERGMDIASVRVDTPWLRQRFDGKPAHYRLLADRNTKTLIGAQVLSEEIVSGTIDKLAVAIAAKMPLVKLVQIDSCYSPRVQENQIAVPIQRLIDELS